MHYANLGFYVLGQGAGGCGGGEWERQSEQDDF